MRIGYAMGNPVLIKYLNDVKYSFNSYTMDQTTLALGAAAIADRAYFEETVHKVVETREWTKKELTKLGFVFGDSKANFIFASHPEIPAADLFAALREAISSFVILTNRELPIICVLPLEHRKI